MGWNIILYEVRVFPRGRVTWYPAAEAAAAVHPAYPTFLRRSNLIWNCTKRDNSPFNLFKMTLGKTVNSTFWVLLLFVRRVGQPAKPASLPASQPASLPKLSLPCRAKRGNPHSNAYPNSCVQIKEAWHCCFGRAPSTMGQQSKAATQCTANQWCAAGAIARHSVSMGEFLNSLWIQKLSHWQWDNKVRLQPSAL